MRRNSNPQPFDSEWNSPNTRKDWHLGCWLLRIYHLSSTHLYYFQLRSLPLLFVQGVFLASLMITILIVSINTTATLNIYMDAVFCYFSDKLDVDKLINGLSIEIKDKSKMLSLCALWCVIKYHIVNQAFFDKNNNMRHSICDYNNPVACLCWSN